VLRRIEETESQLNAYVQVMSEDALAAARQVDRDFADGTDRGPLQGIPIGVKDIFDVRGVQTKCGSRARAEVAPASEDAVSVARVRDAGAVILGKTTTQEFAAGVVSAPARNPWDSSRIPGGSSGGSAAAVAVGSAIAAFGSDTGGSIRNPASLCGIVGLKPTFGSVDTRGVYPLAWSLDTVGPLTRTVEDAALFLNVIVDPAPTGAIRAGDVAAEIGQDIRGLRLGVPRQHFFDRLQADVRVAIETAIDVFADLGAEIVDVSWHDAAAARATSFLINRVETVGVHGDGVRANPELYGEELAIRVQANGLYPAEGYVRALRARTSIRASIARYFADNRLDAVIAPIAPGTAVPADDLFVVGDDGDREHVSLAYTRLTMPFNATGQPVLAVPCGNDRAGLPIGLQIAGRPYAEARLCRIGAAYEAAVGGFPMAKLRTELAE
jgi:aspartyl-tRNA(Asn)/glutamyl-tRNA(Gln) amidotransferase subunit A